MSAYVFAVVHTHIGYECKFKLNQSAKPSYTGQITTKNMKYWWSAKKNLRNPVVYYNS